MEKALSQKIRKSGELTIELFITRFHQFRIQKSYSRVHISSDEVFSKILKTPSIVQKKKLYLIWKPRLFSLEKNKIIFFLKKQNQNGRLKKGSFSSSPNSQYFLSKMSWIGPLVSRIDWCEGHWCGSTYMVLRLSDISSKMAKKHQKSIFSLF